MTQPPEPQERVTPEDATATIALEALARRQADHDLRHARYGPPLMSDCRYVCTEWRDIAAIRAALSGFPLVSVSDGENAEGLSVICRGCGTLTAGVEAGNRVHWVTCSQCQWVSVSPSEEARLLEEAAYLETEAAENSGDVSRLLEVMRGAAARLRGVAVDFGSSAPPKEGNSERR